MGKFAGFTEVELRRPQKSMFDLSHYKRSSTRMGRLAPCLVLEALPSDVFRGSSEILARIAPMLAPIYDNMTMYVHYFFVPNRLLWAEWETFITGGRLGPGSTDPASAPIPPYVDLGDVFGIGGITQFDKSTLADYLGVPLFEYLTGYNPVDYAGCTLDVMPFLAYQQIWMDYYRDRNYVADDYFNTPMPVPSGAYGEVDFVNQLSVLRTRAYMQDYFTSALPFTQRGAEVLMPVSVSGDLPIYANPPGSGQTSMVLSGITQPGSVGVGVGVNLDHALAPEAIVARLDQISSSTSINDFRAAFSLQVWLERNALGGSRYNESTQAHFGVRPQDSRLQRAEYIGGGRISIKISPVVSTAYSEDSEASVVPLANLGGYGAAYGDTNRFTYFCAEHGFIMGIVSIMNAPSYHQGLPRMFNRRTFLDYVWPTFAKLGEQQIDKSELFASADNMTVDPVTGQRPLFGYTSRYADWKVCHSTNHGEFHDTLMHWTLTREFETSPELGELFVTFDETTQDRIFAVNGEDDNFWLYVNNRVSVNRPLPYFGTPNTLNFS